ncbi:multidrug resistance-like protein [Akanthomyces lecanii RCEF 1005]|uniref:Multidrug resistance-like protein n=1 Tax=Akanthomyces lecanii RCEF 1005 TaxID=1081108 RepID=A0A162KDW1_CORDF|nr:multidrug resistance-like protein [Akanthomyces lecanii RCEF 1005]
MDASSAPVCAPTADAAFGPIISDRHCRGGFDFTLVFEQSIFVLAPGCVLLLLAPFRLAVLLKRPQLHVVRPGKLRVAKLMTAASLAALQLALVVLWARRPPSSSHPPLVNSVSLAAACVSCASSVMSCALSYLEHVRSPRPSSLLNVFLLLSLLLDAALLRTLWLARLLDGDTPIRAVFSAVFAVKAALVLLEARGKTAHLVRGTRALAPEETAGIYARAALAWVAPLLRTGFRRLLRPDDMFALDDDMSTAMLNEKFWAHWNTSLASSTYKLRLIRCCIYTLKGPLLAIAAPRLVLLFFTICQPLILQRFLDFLSDKSQPVQIGYGLIAAYGIDYVGIAFSQALYWHRNARAVTMLRGTLVAAVFSKVDVIIRAAKEVHEFWANLIQIAIGTWLLTKQLGYAAIGPIVVALLALAAIFFFSPRAKRSRVGWLAKTQERVGITSVMIGHIKSIKMVGLVEPLSRKLSDLRVSEVAASRAFRVCGSITSALAQIPVMLSPVLAFALYQGVAATTGQKLDENRMFTALAYITLLSEPWFWMFEAVLDMSAASGAFDRIEKYLLEYTKQDTRLLEPEEEQRSGQSSGDVQLSRLSRQGEATDAITVRQMSAAWSKDHTELKDITFSLARGKFGMLLGSTASGKSTLLKSLLGEVPHTTGTVKLGSPRVSWCEQSPWILNQTIRENVIGYAHYDVDRYDQVVQACALHEDFAQLPQGDMTVVGSKGMSLSGGQKQRVSIARALYFDPEIAIFDDVLSGLDNHTALQVFRNVFAENGLLRRSGTTILLATQTAAFLPFADILVSLDGNGGIGEVGAYRDLKRANGYTQSLVQASRDAGPSATSEEQSDEGPTLEVVKKEHRAKETKLVDDKRRQLGDRTVYSYYFGSVGSLLAATLLGLEIGWAFLQCFPTVWLNFWAAAVQKDPSTSSGHYLGTYAALQILAVVWFAILIWFGLINIAAKAGVTLHQRLLTATLRAPLSLFTSTDTGVMTTRFSQDIGILDNQLPLALVVSLGSLFSVIAKAGLLAASSYYVAISFPFIAVFYYYLQRGYLRTSRQLRFLDLEEKAPVYSQFLETLAGLPTVRAFGWGSAAIHKNHDLVDRSQKPFYLLIIVQKWLIMVLDLVTAGLALLIVGFAVYLRDKVSVGLTGVALVQLISMSQALNMLIQFWTSVETSIGAVARIKNFTEEAGDENKLNETAEPPETWPSAGGVVISDLTASYDEREPVKALDGIKIVIKPGEKVGICGRTGSGKSSLLLSFLRLLDASSGSIVVDGVNLATLPRDLIRSRIVTVSQDHFVLPGTVRENLDPFCAFETSDLIEALEAADIWATIERKGGLDVKLGDDMLSHGQKQLFSLARAILRKDAGRIVLLDEATSRSVSVDGEIEVKVQKVVETLFKNHTVISIAHHLDTIIDFDKVVLLDKGKVAEIGRPRELLQSNTMFRALWEASHGR